MISWGPGRHGQWQTPAFTVDHDDDDDSDDDEMIPTRTGNVRSPMEITQADQPSEYTGGSVPRPPTGTQAGGGGTALARRVPVGLGRSRVPGPGR